jgi:hypothetical protein
MDSLETIPAVATLNFNRLKINRAIAHRVLARKDDGPCSVVVPRQTMLVLPPDVVGVFRDRLIRVMGEGGQAHALEIKESGDDSFFACCEAMRGVEESVFVQKSIELAEKLAKLQTRKTIPDAYLWLVDGEDDATGARIHIVIKAELQEALMVDLDTCKRLTDIFLSPAQKLFKIGVLYERLDSSAEASTDVNGQYGCLLFDSGWRGSARRLASYFCKDFLGFSQENIARHQVLALVEDIQAYLKGHSLSENDRIDSMGRVGSYLAVTDEINPYDLAAILIDDPEQQADFRDQIAARHPGRIYKDLSLVENRLKKYRINFENDVTINGPTKNFGQVVEVVDTPAKLLALADEIRSGQASGQLSRFTVVRIQGKPLI